MLAILAILTLVAVVATESTVDQVRFDVTQRTLQNIDDAALGQPDAMSFVSDVGRLPVSAIDPDEVTGEVQLVELWKNVNSLRLYGLSPTPMDLASDNKLDPDVTLLVGWRGPYLRLSPGQTKLTDGWGNSFLLFQPNDAMGNPVPVTGVNQSVFNVVSRGGANPPYDPASVTLSLPVRFASGQWSGTVQGSIINTNTMTTATNPVTIRLFVPDMRKVSGIRVMTYQATSPSYRFVFPIPQGDPNYVSATDDSSLPVPVGPRALRASQTVPTSVKGPVVYIKVPAGGITQPLYLNIQ